MILVTGKPRTGKSQIAKNIVCQMKDRNILFFDYSGEWGLSRFSNVFSTDAQFSGYLPNLREISDWQYPISSYSNKQDWMTLGMGIGAAEITAMIAKRKDIHNDDFDTFRKMLKELPYSYSTEKYNQKWGMNLTAPIHSESWKSIQKSIDFVEPIFREEGRIYNIDNLFKNGQYVSVNLKLQQGNLFSQKVKARLLVGKILETLSKKVWEYSPVIVIEEADILCPLLPEGEYFSSVDWIQQFVLKLGRRYECLLIFIVQDEKRCDSVIGNEYDFKITHEHTPFTWDRGVFSFASSEYGKNVFSQKILFRPFDPSSQYEHYPEIVKRW